MGDFHTFAHPALPVLIQILSCFFETGAEFQCNSDFVYQTFQKLLDVAQFTKYKFFNAGIQKLFGQGIWIDISIFQVGGVGKDVWLPHYHVE